MIILDTNVVSELIRSHPAPTVLNSVRRYASEQLFVTAITSAELRYGCELLPAGRRREKLAADIAEMLGRFEGRILPFDDAASHPFAELAARTRRAGFATSQLDMQIAAIALNKGAAILTRNIRDFELSQVPLINPWTD